MDILALSSSAYLALQGTTLLLVPRLIVSMTVSEPRRITDLETYLCRAFGLTLLALAAVSLLLTNVLPIAPSPPPAASTTEDTAPDTPPTNPYAFPTAVVLTTYHAASAFYLYTQLTYARGANFAFTAGCVGSTALFSVGIWTVLFGGGKGRFSKTTGADKHTANFPFANQESAKSVKKEFRKEEREKRRSVGRSTRSGKEL